LAYSIFEDSNDVATAGFGFEPSALGWHNQVCISHIEKLVDADRMHRKGSQTVLVAAANKTLQASTSSNEVNCRACSHILNSKDVPQNTIIQNLHVKSAYSAIATMLSYNFLDGFVFHSTLVPLSL